MVLTNFIITVILYISDSNNPKAKRIHVRAYRSERAETKNIRNLYYKHAPRSVNSVIKITAETARCAR